MSAPRPRVMIAGTHSGCGKTTVTLALLGALRARGERCVSFKCGPDYIDPLFHREVLGVPCRNLDLHLCSEEVARGLLAKNHPTGHLAVVEGVMGYYDGVADTDRGSSHHLAQATATPVVLVVGCRGRSLSLAAEIQGFLRFRKNRIAAVVLNGATARSYPRLKGLVEEHCGVPVLGYLPRVPQAELESRHLGLVTAAEVGDLRGKLDILAAQAAETLDLAGILNLAGRARPLEDKLPGHGRVAGRVPVAVALDRAFCFYYQDSLDLLAELGAELRFFSPLAGQPVPEEACGLLLGGGYPELYAGQLSGSHALMDSLRVRVGGGLPTVAECGGMLLLCRSLTDSAGAEHPMAGVLPTACYMGRGLGPFGYVALRAGRDNLLCRKGEVLPAHEFHYTRAEDGGDAFTAVKADGSRWPTAHATGTLYAGYPHLHFWGAVEAAARFVAACGRYREARGG